MGASWVVDCGLIAMVTLRDSLVRHKQPSHPGTHPKLITTMSFSSTLPKMTIDNGVV